MISEATIIINSSDSDIADLNPSGISFNYGVNMIPYVILDLSPDDMFLLCDFETKRRKDISITAETTHGCLTFDGLVDGLSFNQSSGNIQQQLIIKSNFQILVETIPRMPGFHPMSVNIMKRVDTIRYNFDQAGESDWMEWTNFTNDAAFAALDTSQNIIKFFISAAGMYLQLQRDITLVSNANTDTAALVALAQAYSDVKFAKAIGLVNSINTTYTDNININASDPFVSDMVMSAMINSTGSIFEQIISSLTLFGCSLVIGNNAAYTVPYAGFLSSNHQGVLPKGIGILSKEINVAYPDQWGNVSFNDNGYQDIKAVYLVSDENTKKESEALTAQLGSYIDNNSQGGVLVVALPEFMAYSVDSVIALQTADAQKSIKEGDPNLTEKLSAEQMQQQLDQAEEAMRARINDMRTQFLDNWAQLKYLQYKYTDRTGSFTMQFNPRWAPGAVGILYTRQPGIYIDFYVTSVTHKLELSPGNSGAAITIVNFNCGRVGRATTGAGLDQVNLFKFSSKDSAQFATSFVTSIV